MIVKDKAQKTSQDQALSESVIMQHKFGKHSLCDSRHGLFN